ncbi:MAG: hypothetical protein IKO57_09065 [Treponema sp.]|nr:hypothetical protein [Treponema sp.]
MKDETPNRISSFDTASVPYQNYAELHGGSAKVWTYILYVPLCENKILQSVVARRVRPVFCKRYFIPKNIFVKSCS